MVKWCAIVLVAASACAGKEGDGGHVVELSAAAEPIYALMKWDGAFMLPSCADAAAQSGVDPAADPAAIEAAVMALAGDLLDRFAFDPLDGHLNVNTIEREIMRGPDLTDEQLLRDGVTAVITAIGGENAGDQLQLELSGTTVVGGEMGDEPTAEMLDKNVGIQRLVLGVGLGDYGNASFETDGPLISMFATWRRIDYDASTLCVDGIATEEDVMAALAEVLAADGFTIEPTTVELDVGTFYQAIDPALPTSDTWTLRPVGYAALIDSRGGTIPTYEYYLDDGTSLAD
ncbi:MAG TPA: hypothetical protein VG755_41490 [Nannocystaceae bacterium]|nr:hypothetical protein [Nannocystaceae bacterium]